MLVLRFVWASVIAGLDNWTGLHSWTELLDSNFNALKILLSSPIIFIYTCRVAHALRSNNLQDSHFVAKRYTYLYLFMYN